MATLREMAPELFAGAAESSNKPPAAEPSARLRAVIEQLARDPSKAQEIAANLQREDPALFRELLAWIQSQQS